MIKLCENQNDGTINVGDMKDGDVAVIVKWSGTHYIGRVVQRYKEYLIALGMSSGGGWGPIWSNAGTGWPWTKNGECQVRILEKGTKLELA